MFVVLPSEWYENNPRSAIEAFALGKPVVGSNIGGIPELVRNTKTGLIHEPGNAVDLRNQLVKLMQNPSEIQRMGRNARRLVLEELNEEVHYNKLLEIYRQASAIRERSLP